MRLFLIVCVLLCELAEYAALPRTFVQSLLDDIAMWVLTW